MLGPPPTPPFDPGLLRLGADLRRLGAEPSPRTHERVRRGVWMDKGAWAGLIPLQRHAALVQASALCRLGDDPAVFCRTSAAALHGLPRVSPWPVTVSTLVEGDPVAPSGYVRRVPGEHRALVLQHGLLVTSVARTIVDLAAVAPLVDVVAAADYALRFGLVSRAEMLAEVDRLPPGTRGRRVAGLAVQLAHGLSMSVGESLSKVQMFLLNVPRPVLQQEFHDEAGLIGQADFDWPERKVIGEFDGRVKYGVEPGADAADALWREKRREDRLRRRGRDVCRWVWAEAIDRDRLGRLLAHHGIRPQPRNRWFSVGETRTSP